MTHIINTLPASLLSLKGAVALEFGVEWKGIGMGFLVATYSSATLRDATTVRSFCCKGQVAWRKRHPLQPTLQ